MTAVEESETAGAFTDLSHAGLDFRERQRQKPADRDCPPVCGALGRYAGRQYRLPVLGRASATGKSYLAGCIANALMEKEIPVHMTNFALILNDLCSPALRGRNEYISRLCRYPLLIIDDFGMERGTDYGLEQVFNVIDSRYRSGKPLIVTTNLTLDDLQNPAGHRPFPDL